MCKSNWMIFLIGCENAFKHLKPQTHILTLLTILGKRRFLIPEGLFDNLKWFSSYPSPKKNTPKEPLREKNVTKHGNTNNEQHKMGQPKLAKKLATKIPSTPLYNRAVYIIPCINPNHPGWVDYSQGTINEPRTKPGLTFH